MKFFLLLLAIGFTLHTLPAHAYFGSHYCSQPSIPYEGSDSWEWENFKSELENYKNCIEEYIESAKRKQQEVQSEAEDQMQDIKRKADDAVEEFNSFVNSIPRY